LVLGQHNYSVYFGFRFLTVTITRSVNTSILVDQD